MMATAGPTSSSSFLPLLESVEDSSAGQSEQTDAYLTIAKYILMNFFLVHLQMFYPCMIWVKELVFFSSCSRLSGEEGRQFLPAVEKHFSRFGKATLVSFSLSQTLWTNEAVTKTFIHKLISFVKPNSALLCFILGSHMQSQCRAEPSCTASFRLLCLPFPCCLRSFWYVRLNISETSGAIFREYKCHWE